MHDVTTEATRPPLRCLAHPATVLAIAVLLVNDHVLKLVYPGWLTGKLSDFAGLFFFPLLVAEVAILVLRAYRPDPRCLRAWVGPAAIGMTAAWFALIKTVPAASHWTAAVASWLTGGPTRIVLDPTDLIALLALWPAWRLWRRSCSPDLSGTPDIGVVIRAIGQPIRTTMVPDHALVASPRASRLRRVCGWIALTMGTLATLATTRAAELSSVERLTVDGPVIYATGDTFPNNFPNENGKVVSSTDGGRSWVWTSTDSASIDWDAFAQPAVMPVTACAPPDRTTCYRAEVPTRVLVSRDGGQTWEVDWEIAPVRYDYMRLQKAFRLFAPPAAEWFRPGPFDLVILGHGDAHTVVVALGTEGMLVKRPDGVWDTVGVDHAQPSLPQAPNPIVALYMVIPELLVVSLVAALAAGALWLWARGRRAHVVPSGPEAGVRPRRRPIQRPFLALFLILVACGSVPFLLWALGVIPPYWAAVNLAVAAMLAALVWGMWRLRMRMAQAAALAGRS